MHVLVTGAGGFVGAGLVERLLGEATALPRPLTRLSLIDRQFGPVAAAWRRDARVQLLEGDFADAALLDEALATRCDLVFHLASVPGSLAEREQALGMQVNLLAPLALLQRLSDGGTAPDEASATRVKPHEARATRVKPHEARATRVVFASSVAVYGDVSHEAEIDETRAAWPALSYGTHKRMTELWLADLSRRGLLDGISLRLPGIVARPPAPSGHGSAFMSELIRRLAAGERYVCPVSERARCWWMSLPCCIDNLLHAARLSSDRLDAERCVQLPVLTATTAEVVAAIEAEHGRRADVRWQPDERIEALFGRQPRLHTPKARALVFTDDGSLAALVRRAVADEGVGGGG